MTQSAADQPEQLRPGSNFPAVVGAILQRKRKESRKEQKTLADALGMKSISAWSKVENGETALTVEQLALACVELETTPSAVLREAEAYVTELSGKGFTTWATRAEMTANLSRLVPVVGSALLPFLGATAAGALAGSGVTWRRETLDEVKRTTAFKNAMARLSKVVDDSGDD